MGKANIEDFYPLSPLQQGILFHSLDVPGSGVYCGQMLCELKGNLNLSAFEQAWQQTIDRHSILRTGFVWQGVKEPVQVVHRQVKLPITHHNWRELDHDDLATKLESLRQCDRAQGFNLSQPPLTRLSLIHLAEDDFRLLWTHHHLLLDGWSLPLLFQEVISAYQTLTLGQSLALAAPRPYRDYIVWLQQQDLTVAERFWRQQLQGFTAPTSLQVDRKSKHLDIEVSGCGRQQRQLSSTATTALQNLARQHQLTLNTLIQGAWALLLNRYSREEDVVFGVTSAGRPADLVGVESMLGLFINTLPLRVEVQPETSLLPWLQRLQAQQAAVRQYEYSPLMQVQRWSEVPQGMPLFESIVVFQNYPLDTTLGKSLDNLAIGQVHTFEQTNYPLTVLAVSGTTLELRILYDRQRFEDDTITRMLGHLQTLLEGMVAQPTQNLGQLPLLTATEQQQLLVEWNQTQREFPQDLCIHELFEQQAQRTPDATAVVFADQSLTYTQLNQQASQLAHYLQQQGVEPETLVGLCVERSLEMVVGLLGILKAGGAYVPLDPAAPADRLAFMLADSQAPILLTQASLLPHLPQHTAQVICLDRDWPAIQACSPIDSCRPCGGENPESIHVAPAGAKIPNPSSLAYVIYTSGSTGKPKGVLVGHSNVTRLFAATADWFKFTEQDVWTLFHSYAFDFSVWELWGALLYGGRLVVVPYEVSRDPDAFYELLCQEKVTVLNQTPSAFRQLIQAETVKGGGPAVLNLRWIIFGGEALELSSLKPWCDRHGDQVPQFVNMYGITETTVHATYRPINQADIESTSGSVIGRALPDLQLYVLDPQQQPVPIGVAGELYVGGSGVTRGYLNRPELTAERFIANPFCSSAQRLYRSGDLARYLANGDLEYLGRIDTQVKLRGYRIELGEIEAVLRQHPDVQDALVLIWEDQPGDQRLVAYVVLSNPSHLLKANYHVTLRSFLQTQLPKYMVATTFVTLERLPLTLNGKVNRAVLPIPDTVPAFTSSTGAPRTPFEMALLNLWEPILGITPLDIHDNFFELGGHSLLAAQVIARVREIFKVDLPIRALFESPTIAGLAAAIENQLKGPTVQSIPPIQPVSRSQTLPLSFSQRRLWVLDQMEPGNPAYNIPVAVRLQGELQISALEQSFRALINRHEALRTTFTTIEGQPVQVIHPLADLPLRVVDLSQHPDLEIEVKVVCLAEAQRPFDLAQGPLLRVTLLKLAAAEHVVLLTLHHIVSDGWSMGVLIQELAACYRAFVSGQPPSLAALPIQYADFAVWQQQWLQGDVLERQLRYWQQQLRGASSFLALPTDRPRPPVQTFRGAQEPIQLPLSLSQDLNHLSRREGTTLFMTLLAAFNVLLHFYTQQTDILVGSPIANRNRTELELLIGFFVNTLVLRTDLSGNPSFRKLLHRVREVTLGAYAHPDLPVEKLVEVLQIERTLSHNPLFQVWFVLQNAPASELELPGLTLSPMEIDHGTARYDLKLNLWESPQGLTGSWTYKTDLFEAATIRRLGERFASLLTQITQQPDTPLSELVAPLAEDDRQHQEHQAAHLAAASLQKLKMIRRRAVQR